MAVDPASTVSRSPTQRPGSALPRSRPSEQGVDPAAIDGLLDAIEQAGIELHSLMVLRHGAVVAEGWWSPYSPDRLHLLYSLSKSFTSAAVGLAIAEGHFGLNDLVLGYLGEFAPDHVDERFKQLTVRHVLSMATGHERETVVQALTWCLQHGDPEMLRGFFRIPPERDPGTVFAYNQPATYCAARIVEKTTGQRVEEYLTPRLLEPLGIADHHWLTEGGHDVGYSGFHLTTESIGKFGQLCLQQGGWNGQQLLPADWVRQATSVQMPNDVAHQVEPPDIINQDWLQGYGFQFWMSRHGYRGDGACGQFCLVWPEQDAVIVTTAAVVDMQALLTMIEQNLLPGMCGSPSSS
ncbi:MAG: beta-lactamase family protein, partial [Actinomycetota bacterium]|nr:beta-lactamase family protein [Actinomycetota bacterium]